MAEESSEYPGDAMTPREILELADEYSCAADALFKLYRVSDPKSLAPFRLAALHAIELYLAAFLRLHGHENAEIRKSGHRCCEKAEAANRHRLQLRQRTLDHLCKATQLREYLVTRYDLNGIAAASPVSQLKATLLDVKQKVSKQVLANKNPGAAAGVRVKA